MKRAKFETREKQREFFIEVKRKLRVGAKKLSEMLGLKSRGSIESYTFMRTAPPVDIVKRLKKLSGIKASYKEIEGKIYNKQRGFTPIEIEDAQNILRNKFKKNFSYLIGLIKTNLTITQIMNQIRKKGHRFDNHLISRCIGSYRKDILSKIVPEINLKKGEIILQGHVRKVKGTLSVSFNLSPLYKKIKEKQVRVGLEISKDRKKIRIFPLNFGRKLTGLRSRIRLLITKKSELKIGLNVEIILNPDDFGFSISESIYDNDAKILVKEAIKEGFVLDFYRSTPNNHKGDLSLYKNSQNILIEITKANSYKGAYFKVGQCFIQKINWPKSIQFLVCKKEFLSKSSIRALRKLNVKILYTNFNKEWEKEVIKEIKNGIK